MFQSKNSTGVNIFITVANISCDVKHYEDIIFVLQSNTSKTEQKSDPIDSLSYTFRGVAPGTHKIQILVENKCKQLSILNTFEYTVENIVSGM